MVKESRGKQGWKREKEGKKVEEEMRGEEGGEENGDRREAAKTARRRGD